MAQPDDFGPRRAHYAPRLVGLIRFSSFVPSAAVATQAFASVALPLALTPDHTQGTGLAARSQGHMAEPKAPLPRQQGRVARQLG